MTGFRKPPFIAAIALLIVAMIAEAIGACFSMGLFSLLIFDWLVLMTVLLIGAPFLLSNETVGRIQGFVTFGVSFFVLLAALAAFGVAVMLIFKLLVSLYGIFPYLFSYMSFPTRETAGILSIVMVCKFGFCILAILAHEKLLINTGLVVIVLTSLLLTMMVGFLNGMPRIAVSITDDIGAIIIAVLACLRAFGFMVASLPAVKKATGL